MDTFNGFSVHLKWIRCTPEVGFRGYLSLNILIKAHTETVLFIALSTRKPALLRDSARAILYIGFLQRHSIHRGFGGYLRWICCTPEMDLLYTRSGFHGYLSLNLLINIHIGTALL